MFAELDDCFIWSCDSCGKEVVFKPYDFFACVAELKARGWGFDHDNGEWSHACGRCRHKHQQTNIMDRTFKTVK